MDGNQLGSVAHPSALDLEDVELHNDPRRLSTIRRSVPMRRSHSLLAGLFAASLGSAAAEAPAPTVSRVQATVAPHRAFAVEGAFQTADRPPARDLSGIACNPALE